MRTTKTLVLALFTAASAAPVLYAQAEAPAPAPAEEEVIQLSPFEVTGSQDTGYQASQTLAGTRIRTDLKDVGSAISVITREMLNDIGATDSGTLLQYTTNAEVAGTRGTYTGLGNGQSLDESVTLRAPGTANRVRGLASADNTRDFFVTDIPWDGYNVDRIDIQRGPNSILFGLGSPAGIVNASTRNAEFRNFGSVEGRFGSYASARGAIDFNQEIIDNVLAVRFDALWDHAKYRQKPAYQEDKRQYGAIRFEPRLFKRHDFRTTIRARYEHGDIDANRPRIVTPNDSITAWFRPMAANQTSWTMANGMGKTPVNNGYDANRNDLANIVAGNGLGLQTRNTANPNYQPWLSAPVNQQQPFWLLDGSTAQTYRIVGGYINPGARLPSGATRSASDGLYGKRYADQFFGLTSMNLFASNGSIPLSGSGQYRTASLTDPSVFNFYDTLIDGPNKREFEKWDAYNVDLSQTAFDDRLGLQLTYDRQKYRRGGEALLGNSPTVNIDILKNFQDYYLTTANPTGTTNPNFGRPYVTSTAGGTGTSYESDRRYFRGSLFGELRAADWLRNDFLVKVLGKHRFNGVYSNEKFQTESRSWNRLANPIDWAAYWNATNGSNSDFKDRPPIAFIYLGSSIAAQTSAENAHIPGIGQNLNINNGNAYVFDSTWQNFGVGFNDPWTIPNQFTNGLPTGVVYDPSTPAGGLAGWTQASNPANYTGWTYRPLNLLRYDNGADESLLTGAQKSFRVTKSYAGSWQAFLWNEAIVPTLGWRYDEIKSKGVSAPAVNSNRSMLNLQPNVYRLPDTFPQNQIFRDHSTAGGVVVHLNKLLAKDPLPINISLSYNKSTNFQVTDLRRDVFGNPISNPKGNTKDYGVLLSTKDGKYTFRAMKYETAVSNADSQLSNPAGIGGTIAQGLRFRNVFLYKMSLYTWDSRETPAQRNTWGGPAGTYSFPTADSSISVEEGRRREDAAINAWNDIQKYLEPTGFFQYWGFTPQSSAVLTDRSTYEATLVGRDPAAKYQPDLATINSTVTGYSVPALGPQGFTVTADTMSEGYEYEFTANPLPNWRIAINAAQTEATRSNVGGKNLADLIEFMDSKLYNPDGTPTWAGAMPQFGNTGLSINNNNYNPWRGGYTLMKIQEGAAAPEVRKWRYNVVSNYEFRDGFMKGVGVGGAYRWQDKAIIGYPVLQDGSKFTFDLKKPYYGPSEDAVDLWLSYERKITKRIGWKIQLNVRNAFAKDGLIPISIQPDGRTWASVRVQPNREWFVTNTLSF